MSQPLVVVLHGHGDHPQRLLDALAPALPAGWAVHAPSGVHGSPQAPSWFDVDDPSAPLDAQIAHATTALATLVEERSADRPVVLLGYSQGAALATTWLLSHRRPPNVAGIALLAGFLPPIDPDRLVPPNAADASVLMVHGTDDETVPLPLGRSVARLLERNGAVLSWHQVDGGHALDATLVSPVGHWLRQLDA